MVVMKRRLALRLAAAFAGLAIGLSGCTSTGPPEPSPTPDRPFEANPTNNRPETCQGWVALTFDDGPTELTPTLLQVLHHYQVPATFFTVGVQEEKFPDKTWIIAADGHVMGTHTMTHADLLALPHADAMKEITDATAIHHGLGLPRQRLFRPPYGSTSPELRAAVEKLGMMEVLWTVDSKDYETDDPAGVYEQSKGMKDGGIVLLHDGKEQTIAALPSIITYYQDQGLCWGIIGRGDKDTPTVAGLPMVARAMAPTDS